MNYQDIKIKTIEDILQKADTMKQELTQLIEETNNMKKRIKEIEESTNEISEPKKRWKPKYNDDYYICDINGNIYLTKCYWDNDDHFIYSIGNCFKTEEEAENYKEKLIIRQELKDLADELNHDNPIDWKDEDQRKYYIILDKGVLENSYSLVLIYQGVIYCTDKKFLSIAINNIGENRLMKLFEE